MKKSTLLLVAIFCIAFNLNSISQVISGTVFRDFNGNGAKDNTASFNEPFVAGITVKAFNAAGVQVGGTQTTSAVGAYSITTGAGSFRIEFTGLGAGDYSSSNGTANGTNVQFVTAPSAATNYAINAPDDYWDNAADPILLMAVQNKGQKAGDATNRFSLLQLKNSTSGVPTTAANSVTVDTSKRPSLYSQTGSIWGVGYQKKQDRYFASASLKRLSDLGQYGIGGVYFTSKSASDYIYGGGFTLDGVTPSNGGGVLNFGSITRTLSNTISDNNLATTTGTAQSRDMDAFAKANKMSFGDIDFDGGSDNLYMLNLFQKRLVVFDASASNATLLGASAATLAPYTLAYDLTALPGWPTAAGVGDNIRPWALAFNHGKGYIGVVSDASTTQLIANLKGYILQFDPNNIAAGFTTVLTINFDKYGPASGLYQFGPWKDTWPTAAGSAGLGDFVTTTSTGFTEYPQPVISDINFNEDGSSMDIAIKDRFGDQTGYLELLPISGNANYKETAIRGDLLHACLVSGAWAIEGTSGSCVQTLLNSASTSGTVGSRWSYNNTGNEYYADYSGDTRAENGLGSLAKLMGTQRMVSAVMDPMDAGNTAGANHFFTSGLQWNNILTGVKTQNARVNYGGPLAGSDGHGKSNCLGDLEFATPPQPIQIGNRIWQDTNGNGVQDAGETSTVADGTTVTLRSPGIDGIYGNGDDQTWTTTTTTGNYYFSALSSADNRKPSSWTGVGNTLLPGYDYRIEMVTPTGFQVTKANAASNTVDNIDNDAIASSTNAYVTFNTSNTNHNFDIGFKPLASLGDKVWLDNGVGGGTTNNGTQDGTEPGVAGVTVTLYASNGTTVLGTTITDAYGNYLFDNLAAATYVVGFTLPANYQFTTQTNTTDDANTTGIGATAAAVNGSDANATTGKTYGVVLSAGENNRNIDAGLIFNTPVQLNSIGDKVWFDNGAGANAGNGVQNTDEPGVAGVSVTLYASNGNCYNSNRC
jgi:SdrD B-like domain